MRWRSCEDRSLMHAFVFGDDPKDLDKIEEELRRRGLFGAATAVYQDLRDRIEELINKKKAAELEGAAGGQTTEPTESLAEPGLAVKGG